MYRCESWTRRLSAKEFMLLNGWCWARLLRVPWKAKRSNQSILKEISPEYSLEGLMLKLKLQYFGHLMRRANLLEKILILGKTEGKRSRGQQRMRRLDGTIDSMDMSLSKLQGDSEGQGSLVCCSPWGLKQVRYDWATEQQQQRTWKQPRYPLTDEWIKKLWYIYTMEYYSAHKKNTSESILMRWMNLEPIIQNEVRKRKTNVI